MTEVLFLDSAARPRPSSHAGAQDLLAVKGFDTRDTVLTCYSGAGFDRELQAGQHPGIGLVGLDQLYAHDTRF